MSAPRKSESPGGTGQVANLTTDTATVQLAEYLSNTQKQVATLKAQFALKGHAFQTLTRADDGRETFLVSNWGQSRCFTHLHDVQAFLNQIGGAL